MSFGVDGFRPPIGDLSGVRKTDAVSQDAASIVKDLSTPAVIPGPGSCVASKPEPTNSNFNDFASKLPFDPGPAPTSDMTSILRFSSTFQQ